MTKIKYFVLLAAFVLNNIAYSSPINNLQVDSIIQAFMTEWNIPGGSFSMMYNKTLLYSKAYGYADTLVMEPAKNRSLFRFIDKNLSTGTYKYRLKQIDYNGNYEYYNLSNDVIIGTPDKYSLSANYPNPFNPQTRIDFQIPISRNVKLTIFDVNGKEVMTILNGFKDAGYYSVNFDASFLSSGIYFYILESGNFSMSRKMMLMK